MEREIFSQRLQQASIRARDFAREFIAEPLADPMLFRLRLNPSHDDQLHLDERVFPEDSNPELRRRLRYCSADEVVDILWRDGMVPEWINLAVIGETRSATLIEVLACGRFTANEALLHDHGEGRAPFHVLGPALPVGFEEGQRFSVYDRSECWSRDEFDWVARHAAKVSSLELHGSDFDDVAIGSFPAFERMRFLKLEDSPLNGPGLVGLSRQPELRHLWVDLHHGVRFGAGFLKPALLETLTFEHLPAGRWGFSTVASQAAGLERLSLSADDELVLDGRMRGSLNDLSLRGHSVQGDPLPEQLIGLGLHLSGSGDTDIERLLAPLKTVSRLSLRGTPVSNGFVESVVRRWDLKSLDVADTQVDQDCLRRIRAEHPRLRITPSPDVGHERSGLEGA